MAKANPNYQKPHSHDAGALIKKEVRSGSGDMALAALFKDICQETSIDTNKFSWFMELYLSDRRNGVPQNVKDRASVRGNVRKELLSDNLSWKVFCKALRFIDVEKFELSIMLVHKSGSKTYHSIKPISLGEANYYPGTNLAEYLPKGGNK